MAASLGGGSDQANSSRALPARGGPPPGTTQPDEKAQSDAADEAVKPDSSIPGTVPPDKLPHADQPRYPEPVTLTTLEEPPAPLPRTVRQEQEDLKAVAKTVELASKAATDSDRLDNYLPKIKSQFRLARGRAPRKHLCRCRECHRHAIGSIGPTRFRTLGHLRHALAAWAA